MTKKLTKFSKKQWLIFATALVLIIAFYQQQFMLPEMWQVLLKAHGNTAKSQIKTVVNNVVFPVVDMVLAVLFFVKVGTAYFDYKKHGQFEFTAPAILFACLIFTLTAPLYIWGIVGM